MAMAAPSPVEVAQRNATRQGLRTLLVTAYNHARLAIVAIDEKDPATAREAAAVATVYLNEVLARVRAQQEGP